MPFANLQLASSHEPNLVEWTIPEGSEKTSETPGQPTSSLPLLPPFGALSKDPDCITCHPGVIPEEAAIYRDHPGFGLSAHPPPSSSALHENCVVPRLLKPFDGSQR